MSDPKPNSNPNLNPNLNPNRSPILSERDQRNRMAPNILSFEPKLGALRADLNDSSLPQRVQTTRFVAAANGALPSELGGGAKLLDTFCLHFDIIT